MRMLRHSNAPEGTMADPTIQENVHHRARSENSPALAGSRAIKRWLRKFLDGVEHSFELSFTWYLIYIAILLVHTFTHRLTTQQPSPFQDGSFYGAIIGFSLVIFLFYIRFLEGGMHLRLESRMLMLLAAVLTLIGISVPYLLYDDAHGGTAYLRLIMQTGTLVWVMSFALLFLVAVIPGAAFNKDFADLQSFPIIKMLRTIAGAILFLVAARQLLVWQNVTISPSMSLGQALPGILNYDVAPLNLLNRIWSWLEPGVLLVLIALALIASYIHLSIKTTHGRFPDVIWGAIPLIYRQIKARIWDKDRLLWPPIAETSDASYNVHQDAQLIEYSLTTTYPAVTLLFALTVPTILNEDLSLAWSRVLFLGVFIVGNVDIWLQTLDLISMRGIFYTLGAWASTLLLYWPTTLLTILLINDIWHSNDNVTTNMFAFSIAYQFIVPALTILLAFNQLDGTHALRPSRIFRRGIAAVSLFLLLGFGLNVLLTQQPSINLAWPWRVIGYLGLLTILILLQRPRIEARLALRNPHMAQLLTSSSIAITPILINKFVHEIQWQPDGVVDLTTRNAHHHREDLHLRMHVVGSEEEVAWEATSLGRSWLRGKIDFIITDLLTAIDIIGESQRRVIFKDEYRIGAILGDFRWTQTRVAPDDTEHTLVLDAGFLLYSPNTFMASGTTAPCHESGDDCRQSSFAVISHYANKCRDKISLINLPEPYSTWLRRKLEETKAGRTPPRLRLEERTVYVVLMRENGTHRRFDWRRAMAEMILDGQRVARMDQDRLHDDHLTRLRDFFMHATQNKLDFSFSDIHLALCECRFGAHLSYNKGMEPANDFSYPSVQTKLRTHNMLTRKAWGEIVRQVAVEEFDLAADVPIEPAQEAYAIQKLKKDLSEPFETNIKWVRAMLEASKLLNLNSNHTPPILNLALFEGLAAAQTPPTQEFESYLTPIYRFPLGNYPGQIVNILERIKSENFDFKFLSSTNLGRSAFIYLFSDSVLPGQLIDNIRAGQMPFEQLIHANESSPDTLDENFDITDEVALSNQGIDLQQLMAFVVPIRNVSGSLLALLQKLKIPSQSSTLPVNLEQIFVFTLSTDIALALLVPNESERSRLFARLMGRPEPSNHVDELPSTCLADVVSISSGFPRRRHRQQVIFKTSGLIPNDVSLKFELVDASLKAYSPLGRILWGPVERWRPEVDLDEIRLIIPTELVWWINLSDRLRRLRHPFQIDNIPTLFERYSQPTMWQLSYVRIEPNQE